MARKIEASGVFLVLGECEDKEAIVLRLRLNSPELDGFGRGGADHAFANLLVPCIWPNEVGLIVTLSPVYRTSMSAIAL
jgi:hypothetical protein